MVIGSNQQGLAYFTAMVLETSEIFCYSQVTEVLSLSRKKPRAAFYVHKQTNQSYDANLISILIPDR